MVTTESSGAKHMETRLQLKYSGAGVDNGRMDVYAASANMIAFSEFMVTAVKAVYGEKADARAEVAGYGKGSFFTDIYVEVAGTVASLFATESPQHLLSCVKEAFGIWKFLRGEAPKAVKNEGQSVQITNNNGQVIQVQSASFNLVISDKGADTVARFVGAALQREGIDEISIGVPEENGVSALVSVPRDEAEYFKRIDVEKPVSDVTVEMSLIIESPVFKDGNKWRFFDGQTSFYADISDEAFIQRVENGERFGKGDVLKVRMQIVQNRSGIKLSIERKVIEVLEHQDRAFQPVLL